MLERFTRERQRTSRGVDFNLEEEDELTHYGKSLSALDDDFDGTGLALDDDDERGVLTPTIHAPFNVFSPLYPGQIDADTVDKTHFGGFDDDEENAEGQVSTI